MTPDELFAGRTPTDADLAKALPGMTQEQRIETIIRKYLDGGISRDAYDGETPANVAARKAARHVIVKLRPWLEDSPATTPEFAIDVAQYLREAGVEVQSAGTVHSALSVVWQRRVMGRAL